MVEWNDDFSIKIPLVDGQHKILFQMCTMFEEAASDGESRGVLEILFKSLTDYTVSHFHTEEKMMQRYSYPGLKEQMKEHDDFCEKLTEFKERFSRSEMISGEIAEFLAKWLKNHIYVLDKKMGEFLFNERQKGNEKKG
ncbi:bacteriohemerythrin [Candidatus Riflebacteria bacterium]